MNRLISKYKQEVSPALNKEFGYSNAHQVPKIVKVVINTGVGRAVSDSKHLETATATLAKVTGQQPVATTAKKSIAGFKLREGNKIGAMVTLRGLRAYEFLDRLISVVLPRIRDFRGLNPDAFDGQGNYSLGINDQTIFPELSHAESPVTHGLQINIITSATSDEEGAKLLQLMGFPLRRK